ncbi:hypothetical protein PGTUg99_018276 [Puccinia graminis f. sp. tritici]|uniref:Secreted protein n=1 Tax=Puccinia graminis f. sp. tritici TaxID=56615 RepID=A0A5B0RYB1_PUCGR|nr:hypothetical protein PGTUg99_018276 [Puccinia graminis f. sp. tritici]
MLLVFSILVTMLLQVIVLGTPTIHAADQIGLPIPVGPKSLLKPVHQHTKRMDLVENNQYSSEIIIAKVVNPVQVVIHPHMPHVLFVLQEPCVLLLANE